MRRKHVVAVAYDRLCTFEFGCVVELFALHRPELNVDWYRFSVCSVERGALRAAGGIRVEAPHGLRHLDRADIIVIPGWRDAEEVPPQRLLKKIRSAAARGARLCSICSGVFVLAAAGVLDGKRVTTHWRYAERLAERYPRIRVEANALYVEDGQIMTSAGSAAGLDMLLHLVRKDYGSAVANLVARRLVIPPHRDGGQAQFVPRPMPPGELGRISKLMNWLRAHPAGPHSLASMAKRAAMSPRTLQRQFRDACGVAPYEWLVRERVSIARDLLESSTTPLPRIAVLAGFNSEESLRRHFRRTTGTSPSAYRRQFSSAKPNARVSAR